MIEAQADLCPVGGRSALFHSLLGVVPALPLLAAGSRVQLPDTLSGSLSSLAGLIPLCLRPVHLLLKLLTAPLHIRVSFWGRCLGLPARFVGKGFLSAKNQIL